MSGTAKLIEELREESQRLSGRSLDRGCVDSGIAANLADHAAAALTASETTVAVLRAELMTMTASRDGYITQATAREAEYERRLTVAREERDAFAKGCEDWQEDASRSAGELSAISAAIGSVRFMDPPDGGDVSLAEQVSRMRAEVERRKEWQDAIIGLCKTIGSDDMPWGGDKAGWGFIHYFVQHLHTRATASESEVERLTRERDTYQWADQKHSAQLVEATELVDAARAEVERLTKALALAIEEDPRWQKLRDLFGLDGWHDGHFHGIANPDQIVTHIEYVANERARLLFAATTAESTVERLREALQRIAEGNLGDDPWQANYDKIREVAARSLSQAGERKP